MKTLLVTPWVFFVLSVLPFAGWITWLVVPPIVGKVVPIVVDTVLKPGGA